MKADRDTFEGSPPTRPHRHPVGWKNDPDPRVERAGMLCGVARAMATEAQDLAIESEGVDSRRVALARAGEAFAAIALQLEDAFRARP